MLFLSCGRLPGSHGRNFSFSLCAPRSRSYRTPMFSVRRPLCCQSSCAQPAKMLRVGVHRKFVFENAWLTLIVIGDSKARFHVDTSFQSGKVDAMVAALGAGPPVASMIGMHALHHRIGLM